MAIKGYSTSEVAKLLGLSQRLVRGYVRAGFLSPERGERGELSFSFQDLVFLRTARGLMAAQVPSRRIRAALKKLNGQLPEGRPMSAVRIAVEGRRIVVDDGARRWQPESGQILFDFGVADLAKKVAPMVRRAFREATEEGTEFSADDWFEWGCELEPGSPGEAISAYRRAIALDPEHAAAHVNLGRLLHESGDAAAAEPHYEAALAARPDDAIAAFNLGVALEDQNKLPEARLAYLKATRIDPENADAHFNFAALSQKLGRAEEALRHLQIYRKLTRGS
jgi:tetratricopeptide (TPR) repeat protein